MPGQLQQGASAQSRSFRPELARETENVLRRSSEESLDDYLKNINSYLQDLNSRLGEPPAGPPAGEAATAPDAVGAESGTPYASDAPVTDGFAEYGRYPEGDVQDGFVPPYGDAPYAAPYGEPAPDAAYAGTDRFDPAGWQGAQPYYGDPAWGYAEALPPTGYAGGDWQAAVPNPELYPDLDDPAVTGRKSRKKEKKRRRKADRPVKTTKGGKSRFSFVTTVLNLVLYGGWTVLYFVCLTVRSMMFTGAQAEMASQGVAAYSVTISSPLFTALKYLIYAMPVVLLLWMRGVLSAEKKQVPQLNKKLLIAAFAVDLLAGVIVIFDVLAAKLVFGT